MNKSRLVYLSAVLLSALLAQCQTVTRKDYSNVKLSNDLDSASYYLGTLWGKAAVRGKLTEINYEALIKGLDQAMKNDSTLPPDFIASNYLNNYVNKIYEKEMRGQYTDNIEKNEKFLEENGKKEGVITLSSGLQYKIITEGNGPLPTINDKVKADYTGKLIDGTVFDSSVERGEPMVFDLKNLIPGFREALLLMPVGSEWEIFIPEQLAYGAQERPKIPPFSTLIFDVKSLEIVNSDQGK